MQRRAFLQKSTLALAAACFAPRLLAEDTLRSLPSLPFTDADGTPFSLTDDYLLLDDRVLSEVAATLHEAESRYHDEVAAVEANINARIGRLQPYISNFSPGGNWYTPHLEDERKKPLKLRTGTLTKDERTLLHDVDFFGRELMNKGNAYRYDPTWTASLMKEFDLRPTDCTRYLLDAYAKASGDEDLLRSFLEREYKGRTFPWVFAMHLKQDYETVLVVPDTKSREAYFNGSLYGWTNEQLMGNIRGGFYYTSTDYAVVPASFREKHLEEKGILPGQDVIDYYVLDEQTRTPSFKRFLGLHQGIAVKQEFVHLQLFSGDDLFEAQWGNNPLYANTFEKTSLHDRLHSTGDDRIHNVILWVPKGTVQAYVRRAQEERLEKLKPRPIQASQLPRTKLEDVKLCGSRDLNSGHSLGKAVY